MSGTIIVGAGINGLLLGALLAHDGERVTVFERNSFPGGRAFLHERDGFTMDYGVHLTRFGPASALATIMRRIGAEVSFRKLGPSYVIDHNGRKVLFPTSPDGIFKSSMFSLAEKVRLIGLLLKIKKGMLNDGLMETSLRDWMNMNRVTGGVRRYLELLSASVMVCPFIEQTSAGEMFRNLYRVFTTGHSAEYLSGGWKPVYEALIGEIRKNGSIHFGKKVDSVIINKGRAAGVKAAGKKHTAERVVINLPVQELFTILPESKFDREYVTLCKNLVPTSGIFFDIALKKKIADYNGLLYTYRPMAYGMLTSNLAAGLAPVGAQILTMLYPTTMEDIRDATIRMERKEELWTAIRKYFPDISDHILWTRVSCLRMVDGAQVNIRQTEDRRPGPSVPGIAGLYLVGDSIAAPGAGGDVGNESVLLTYRAMTGTVLTNAG
ncbi:MAG: NAD(P)/FAD-dependent oxidoreductase [Spirochaetes bacterium]|nr:NAD(P)/FAD-dependent oxidoreductase [Spirochaetota bacterium]